MGAADKLLALLFVSLLRRYTLSSAAVDEGCTPVRLGGTLQVGVIQRCSRDGHRDLTDVPAPETGDEER